MPDLDREQRRRARADPFAFADAAGLRLAEFKRSALSFDTLFTQVVGPRQTGKSDLIVLACLWAAFRRPGQLVLLCSAGGERVRELIDRIRGLVQSSEILRDSVVDERMMVVSLDNDSEIRAIPASERAGRGWSADLLAIDEAQQMTESMWAALSPTVLARPAAKVLLCGTAGVSSGPFFELAKQGEDDRSAHSRTFYWRLDDCREWVSPGQEAALRAGLSPQRQRSELDNAWESGADCLLPASTVRRMMGDYLPDRLGGRGSMVFGGFDLGVTDDHSVLVCLGRLPVLNVEGLPVFAVRSDDEWASGTPWNRVVADIRGCDASFAAVFADATSLARGFNDSLLFPALHGRPPTRGGGPVPPRAVLAWEYPGGDPFASDEQVAAARRRERYRRQERANGVFRTRCDNVVFSSQSKACMYSALVTLAGNEQLLVPTSATTLIRELTMIRVEMLPSGGERIAAPGRGKDDHCDALALSLAPMEGRDGWYSRVAELARSRAPVALPEPREDWVQGPGYLVPRRPDWLSPAGRRAVGDARPDDWSMVHAG